MNLPNSGGMEIFPTEISEFPVENLQDRETLEDLMSHKVGMKWEDVCKWQTDVAHTLPVMEKRIMTRYPDMKMLR